MSLYYVTDTCRSVNKFTIKRVKLPRRPVVYFPTIYIPMCSGGIALWVPPKPHWGDSTPHTAWGAGLLRARPLPVEGRRSAGTAGTFPTLPGSGQGPGVLALAIGHVADVLLAIGHVADVVLAAIIRLLYWYLILKYFLTFLYFVLPADFCVAILDIGPIEHVTLAGIIGTSILVPCL